MNDSSQNAKSGSARQSKEARVELDRALSLHFQGNNAGALKALRSALQLDPELAHERLTENVARELTGLPATEALKSIVSANESKKLMNTARKEWRRTPQMRRQRVLLFVFALLCIVLIGVVVRSIQDGAFDNFRTQMRVTLAKRQQASLIGYNYYVNVPGGAAPEGGWPMVVAFHGYGSDGRQMLPLADRFNAAGAIFVTPTLGTYEPNPGTGPLEPVSQILTEIGKQYPLQARGAILLGFSQGGTFAYRFSVYHPEQVAGVVTAGAPELDPILPTRNIPYLFTWGELDELQQFVLPQVEPIQSSGYNVRTAIIPGIGHAVSQYAVDQVMLMLKQP